MKIDNYEVYDAQLKVMSPIHIGDGLQISKKEFVFSNLNGKTKILVLDIEKLYSRFIKVGAAATAEFERFLTARENTKTSVSLSSLLFKYKINRHEYVKYEIASTLEELKEHNINTCLKDAFGYPYIPGISIKGMIRSAIMSYAIASDNYLLAEVKNKVTDLLSKYPKKFQFKILEREISDLVDKKFSKIKGVKPFSGLIVGDSYPLSKDSLCLAQKVDLLLNGGENSLNIYKESIGPFTNIHFKLSLDKTKIGEVDIEYIKNALEFYKNQMSDYFFKEFGVEYKDEGLVFLGSAGFVTKTIIYQIFGKDAKKVTWDIFKSTLSDKMFEKHKYYSDKVTPHACKCTEFDDGSSDLAFYDVGQAILTFTRVN
jgi:CRISPR-associated protein Csm5